MRTIDLYIIRKFLGTFFFMIALLIVIVIVFDISEKVDDFLENDIPLRPIVMEYYMNFIPYLLNLFSALITFICVIYFTSRMAYNTEIIAILAAGVSFRRILLPYMVSAIVLAMISFSLSNFIIPRANEIRYSFEVERMHKHRKKHESFIHFQLRPGEYISVQNFSPFSKAGNNVSLQKTEDDKLVRYINGDRISWDSVNTKWTLENYTIREIDGLNERIIRGETLDTILPVKPEDLTTAVVNVDVMNFRELREFINLSRLRGTENITWYQVEQHKRIAYPFATLIMTLIGVSISSRKVRGGIGLQIAMGLLASFTYILFMKITETFATYGNLPPIIAIWIPNFLYTVLGVYLFLKAPK